MLRNYLKISLRNLRKFKVHSFINISGLAIGMACCILILLFVKDELSYDRYHKNAKDIYRVIREVGYVGAGDYRELRVNSGAPAGPLLSDNFPLIEEIVQFYQYRGLVRYGNSQFHERRFFYASESVFDIFTFPLTMGDPSTALKEPFSIVITEEMADKYFGEDDPIGKTLTFENEHDFTITGIVEKIPQNSHFKFDFLASFESLRTIVSPRFLTSHWDSRVWTYILLNDNASINELEEQFSSLLMQHIDKGTYSSYQIRLQPLTQIHLYSHYGAEIEENGDKTVLFIFSAIALFILIIACINFMNLSTARSATRAVEVSIRKVLGGQKSQLMRQFFSESVFVSIIALIFAIVLVEFFLPTFNNLADKELSMGHGNNILFLFFLIGIAFIVGIVSGSYPALFLSGFKPVQVMKRALNIKSSSSTFRKVLVIFQYTISITLIISTLIIYEQLGYLRNKDIGFNKENIITIPLRYNTSLMNRYPLIKNELLSIPDVLGVTASSNKPGVTDVNGILMNLQGLQEEVQASIIYFDYDYIQTLGIEITEGSDFLPNEKNVFFVNESFLTRYEIESAVGRNIELYYRNSQNPDKITPMYRGKIKAVLKDFNCRSAARIAGPVVFAIDPQRLNYISIRISPYNITNTINSIRNKWQEFIPDRPFEFTFLDDDINNIFTSEERMGKIFRYFTLLAIIITSLGLFGLASFMAEQRTKEIGIRKALGASIPNIISLLSIEFLKLVFIANVLAWPVAYFAMNNWLQNFSYQINIGIMVFLLSALFAIFIALFTVSFQAVKAAVTNPIDALRYE